LSQDIAALRLLCNGQIGQKGDDLAAIHLDRLAVKLDSWGSKKRER
jgi:hypothetical protein